MLRWLPLLERSQVRPGYIDHAYVDARAVCGEDVEGVGATLDTLYCPIGRELPAPLSGSTNVRDAAVVRARLRDVGDFDLGHDPEILLENMRAVKSAWPRAHASRTDSRVLSVGASPACRSARDIRMRRRSPSSESKNG